MLHQMVQCLAISKQKYCKLIKHMLSTFQAENRVLHKHTQPQLKKKCAYKIKCTQDRALIQNSSKFIMNKFVYTK